MSGLAGPWSVNPWTRASFRACASGDLALDRPTMNAEAQRSKALDRYARGRARSVAHLLGVSQADIEAEVTRMARDGIAVDVALDWLVLDSPC